MLVVDISEDKDVIDKLEEKVGKDGFKIEQIGCYDCRDRKFPIKSGYCVDADELEIFTRAGLAYNKILCTECEKRKYVRFADFTNATKSFYYERKTILDFISSRKDRLYRQLNKMDTFIDGHKGLILEGMGEFTPVYDAWKNINKNRLKELSPIQQVIELGGRPEWVWSFVRELKMRNMEFVQTWNLDETIEFLIQCDEGYDKIPKLRILPKRYPDISLARNILVLFDGIGRVHSKKMLKEYKTLGKLMLEVKKMDGENKNKNKYFKQIYETFWEES